MLARRARLRSRTPLRRKTRLKARRSRIAGQFDKKARLPARRATARRRPPEYIDKPYLAYLRLRPCRVTWIGPHHGGDPHHARHDERGNSIGSGMKNDRRAISLCRICHGCIDELSGPFKGWTRAKVRAWVDAQIADQRAQFLALSMVDAALSARPAENPQSARSKNVASTQIPGQEP